MAETQDMPKPRPFKMTLSSGKTIESMGTVLTITETNKDGVATQLTKAERQEFAKVAIDAWQHWAEHGDC